MSGYYISGLLAMKKRFQGDLVKGMARYQRMEGMFHPDRFDQGKYIDLMKEFITRLDREIEAVRKAAIERMEGGV